jgi:hypothetical protein
MIPVREGVCGQKKSVPTRLISKSLEFEGFKTRVVEMFLDTEEGDGDLPCGLHDTMRGGSV